jgi:hypothetical protein
MHRDLTRGDRVPDVRQLERSLAALGSAPAPSTAAAATGACEPSAPTTAG